MQAGSLIVTLPTQPPIVLSIHFGKSDPSDNSSLSSISRWYPELAKTSGRVQPVPHPAGSVHVSAFVDWTFPRQSALRSTVSCKSVTIRATSSLKGLEAFESFVPRKLNSRQEPGGVPGPGGATQKLMLLEKRVGAFGRT